MPTALQMPNTMEAYWMRYVIITIIDGYTQKPFYYKYDNTDLNDNSAYVDNKWKGTDFEITVNYFIAPNPSTAQITIYNMSNVDMLRITKDSLIEIKAGYKWGNPAVIFEGRVDQFHGDLRASDVKMILNCTSTQGNLLHGTHIQIDADAGTSIIHVVEDVITSSRDYNGRPLTIGELEDPNEYFGVEDVFNLEHKGPFVGTPWKILDQLTTQVNSILAGRKDIGDHQYLFTERNANDGSVTVGGKYVSWVFYDRLIDGTPVINWVPKTHVNKIEPNIILDSKSGLLEFEPNDYVDYIHGFTLKCLLNPYIKPDSTIIVFPSIKNSYAVLYYQISQVIQYLKTKITEKDGRTIIGGVTWKHIPSGITITKDIDINLFYNTPGLLDFARSRMKEYGTPLQEDYFVCRARDMTHTITEGEFYTTVQTDKPDGIQESIMKEP
jgi:hypothetical protein